MFYSEDILQTILSIFLIFAGLVFTNFLSKKIKIDNFRSNIIYIWHTFFAVLYYYYSLNRPSDSKSYYIEGISSSYNFTLFGLGSEFVKNIIYIFNHLFEFSYFGYFILFSIFGAIGLILIDSVILRIIRDNIVWRLLRPIIAYPIGILVLLSGLIKTRGKSKLYGGHHFFVMDRCFLDELARVEWKLKIRIPFKSIWFRYAPAPDITFYFDIPGATSWERMDPVDTGKKAMVDKEKTYKRLIPKYAAFTDMNVLDTNGFDINAVTNVVFAHLDNKIKSLDLTFNNQEK